MIRFAPLFARDSFKLATSSHPKFKLNWIPEDQEGLVMEMKQKLTVWMKELSPAPLPEQKADGSDKRSSDPLFMPNRQSAHECAISNELNLFFIDTDQSLDMLHKYPRVKEVFIRFNTGIPSSAPVERLFSIGPLILTARRNRLKAQLFEILLLLKIYKKL